MNTKFSLKIISALTLLFFVGCNFPALASQPASQVTAPGAEQAQVVSTTPPAQAIKLIFIHHSTGGNWLADANPDGPYGELGKTLMQNNYFVSATNYGWGPTLPGWDEPVGSYTDIIHWPMWFTGPDSSTILTELYHEFDQNIGEFGNYSRLADPDPGRENEIVIFKSCFPNSNLYGNPDDPAGSEPNDWEYTVGNAKAVYNNLLIYFATRQDKLFVAITAPPMAEYDYALDPDITRAQRAANARAFNRWLVNDWLDGYAHNNVAVFDYYNVLTSNGSPTRVDDMGTSEEPNDLGAADGNHHRWNNGALEHSQSVVNNFSAYPTFSSQEYNDSHPTIAGQQKATTEFILLLNYYYNRWKSATLPALTLTAPTAGANWPVNSTQQIQWNTAPAGSVAQVNLYYSLGGITTTLATAYNNTGSYNWTIPNTPSNAVRVRVESVISPTLVYAVSAPFTLAASSPVEIDVYLPNVVNQTPAPPPANGLLQPADLEYLGAFRLPGDDTPPQTFAYGGNAMTFNPDRQHSDPTRLPGSLFVVGHDRQPYGGLPNGNQVAEVTIPQPVNSHNLEDLPTAALVQNFADVAAGYFHDLDEVPKVGMQYLNLPLTGPLIHMAWGRHLQQLEDSIASHAWINAALATPDLQGVWYIGNQNPNAVTGFMFEIPASWAEANAEGKYLATGRVHGGGLGGFGPALFAYRPWLADGSPAPNGSHLEETILLQYESSYNSADIVRAMNLYQHPDEWEGGAWITTASGKTAVLFAGTKSNGTKYWYGYRNPLGADLPCPETAAMTGFTACRLANGQPCPPEDMVECANHTSDKGWWSTHYDAQLVLYNPADLAKVAAGTLESWQPQPYAVIDIDDYLYLNPAGIETGLIGEGGQRRFRIGDATFDRANGLLYILEWYGDSAKPVIHVWRIR